MIFDFLYFVCFYLKIEIWEADERKLKTIRGTTSKWCVCVFVCGLSSGMLAGSINCVKLCEMFTQNFKTNMSKG